MIWKVNLIQVEKTQSTLKIWSGFRPKSRPKIGALFVMQSRSQDANTGDVKVLSTKAGQMQCKIPRPGEHNTKCWKMPLKCAWGKLQWILLVQSTQLMRRTQNTIHPLRFLGICVKHYPHPLSTLRICLLEPQPIQGARHKLPDPRVNRQDGIPLRQHASLNVWSQRLDFVH